MSMMHSWKIPIFCPGFVQSVLTQMPIIHFLPLDVFTLILNHCNFQTCLSKYVTRIHTTRVSIVSISSQNIPSCLLSKVLLFCLEWWVNWISARWTYSQTERYKFVIVCPPQDCGCWVKLIRYLAAIRGQRPRNQPPGQSRTHLAQGGSSEVLRTDVSEPETAGAPGSWLVNLWSQIQYNKPVYNSLGAVQKETIGNFFVSIQVEDKN